MSYKSRKLSGGDFDDQVQAINTEAANKFAGPLGGHYYYFISIWSGLLAMICGLSLYMVRSPVIQIFIPL